MAVTLRPAVDTDRDFIERVYLETQRWIIEALFGWRGDEIERLKFAETYDAENSSIVVVDGRDAGWLTVQRGADTHIDSIYLATDHQGNGIGTLLLQRLIDEAEREGLRLTLSTAKINPARKLYGRLGFFEIGEDEFKVYMERQAAFHASAAQPAAFEIRSREDADILGCITALRAVHESDGYPSSWPRDVASWLTPTGMLAALIAVKDASVLGHIALGSIDGEADPQLMAARYYTTHDLVEIKRLYVRPSTRGLGIGRALLGAAVKHARSLNSYPVLEVTADRKPAIRLYERSGWRRIGRSSATWQRVTGERPRLYQYVIQPDTVI